MRRTALLVMATGTTLLLALALAATRDAQEPVTEMVVPKSDVPATPVPGTSEETREGRPARSDEGDVHAGAVARLPAFSADGMRLGEIVKVIVGRHGRVTAIHLETGGFLGLGSRVVRVPHSLFSVGTRRIRVLLPAAAIEHLPEEEDVTR